MNKEAVELIANLALTLSFVVGLIFGIAQVKAAARDRKERFTLEALHNFQTREFVELMSAIHNFNAPATFADWLKLPVKEQVLLLQFVQKMESLGILVAEGYINFDLVDKTLGSFVTLSWDKFKNMIADMREKQPDPYLSEYFQWLAEHLKDRMEKYPRIPFYKTK